MCDLCAGVGGRRVNRRSGNSMAGDAPTVGKSLPMLPMSGAATSVFQRWENLSIPIELPHRTTRNHTRMLNAHQLPVVNAYVKWTSYHIDACRCTGGDIFGHTVLVLWLRVYLEAVDPVCQIAEVAEASGGEVTIEQTAVAALAISTAMASVVGPSTEALARFVKALKPAILAAQAGLTAAPGNTTSMRSC